MKKALFLLSFIIVFTLTACSNEREINEFDYPYTYNEGTVTGVTTNDEEAVIDIVVTGFRGDILLTVTVENDIITDYRVTEHEESDAWGRALIEDTTFIQDIIDNSSSLDSVDLSSYELDAESGATDGVTAQALLDAAAIAITHYVALYDTAIESGY